MSQQGKASERMLRDGPPTSEDNGVRLKTAEPQSKKAPQQGGTTANAANTAPRSVSGLKNDAQPVTATMQKLEASAAPPRPSGIVDSKAEGTAVPSGDGKDTPRHYEVTCMTASLPCSYLQHTICLFIVNLAHLDTLTTVCVSANFVRALQDVKPVKPAWNIVVRLRPMYLAL